MDSEINQNLALCDICGERPGAVEVTFVAGGERRSGLLCKRCARIALAHQQGGFPDGFPGGPSAAMGAMPGGQAGGQAVRQRARNRDASGTPALDQFGRDLTSEAQAGRIDPVVGRDEEIGQVVEVLARRRKNNAALIGEAGVGKTAIAEGLALRIARHEVPEPLRGVRVVALDLAGCWPAPSTGAPSSSG